MNRTNVISKVTQKPGRRMNRKGREERKVSVRFLSPYGYALLEILDSQFAAERFEAIPCSAPFEVLKLLIERNILTERRQSTKEESVIAMTFEGFGE